LISTIIGTPRTRSPFGAVPRRRGFRRGRGPRVVTTVPESRKVGGGFDRRVEQAAGVVAQVEHETAEKLPPAC
jgi:hypothetical protein